MIVPNIFPNQPVLRDADRRRLSFGNDQVLRVWLQKPRKPEDYKRAVLVELERKRKPRQQFEMIHKLLVALHKAERKEVLRAIQKHLSKNIR